MARETEFNPARSESDDKMTRDIGRWRIRKADAHMVQSEDMSARRRSLYRQGIDNDGVKGLSSGHGQTEGSTGKKEGSK